MTAIRDAIYLAEGNLALVGGSFRRSVPVSAIVRVHLCTMEDEIHHGDEPFHILVLKHEFALIGPFVGGAIAAIDEMIRTDPAIPVERSTVRRIPFRYRKPGFLGLRLFPVPGLHVDTLDRLGKLLMASPGGT